MNESDAFVRRTGRHFIAGCLQTTTSIVGSDVGHLPPAHIYASVGGDLTDPVWLHRDSRAGWSSNWPVFTPSGTSVFQMKNLVVFN